ncbi:MAG TPA: 2Fe-2S iron-sulfur cluster-binding protein [Candidatus Krumholzibacteria bacterium]|nr:2Fe-2S iron-sulfur cluster-binding protein [Candidatus Krumholzibacteria bacterium]
MPKIHIDEREIEAGANENLIATAARAGVHIPHFCWHPALSVAGNCRQCLVEIEGVPKPQIACNTPLKDGMVVRTKSPAIQEARRGVLEFLLLNHPIDCPICDQAGECRLQEYYMSHGLYDARRNVDKVHKPKVVDLGPHVLLDAERCVLCTRCVRFCSEVARSDELYVAERGSHSEIATFPGQPLVNAYSGNVVDICPVGALLSKEFRFKSRVWWLKKADSVCTSCARGCNVRIDHHWNQVQRQVPRYNPEVNSYWMCDRGRTHIDWINEQRVTAAQHGEQTLVLREAFELLAARLAAAGSAVTVVLSPKLANEDLLAWRHLFTAVLPAAHLGAGSLEPAQPEDDILRRADPHPNTWSVQALELAADVRALWQAPAKLLLLVGDDPVGWDPALAAGLARFDFVAAALTNHNATATSVLAAGGLLLPLATHAEYAGTFNNYAGRVQRFEAALAPFGSALAAHEMAVELALVLRREFWPAGKPRTSVQQGIWQQLAPAIPAMPRIDWEHVPPEGLNPTWKPTARPRSVLTGEDATDAYSWGAAPEAARAGEHG